MSQPGGVTRDYQFDWERRKSPCLKCQGYKWDFIGKKRCTRYPQVMAAGGVKLDLRHPQAMRRGPRGWKGKYKTFWPFDYDPFLILNGCPALMPRGSYCQACAEIWTYLKNPHPEKDCIVCGKPGNVCESCGQVDDKVAVIGSFQEENYKLCLVCYKGLREAQETQRQARDIEKEQASYIFEFGNGAEIWVRTSEHWIPRPNYPIIKPWEQPWVS